MMNMNSMQVPHILTIETSYKKYTYIIYVLNYDIAELILIWLIKSINLNIVTIYVFLYKILIFET